MIKKALEYSNLKNGTQLTQVDLAEHLESKRLGKVGSLQVTFTKLNKGTQKGGNYAMLIEIAKYLKITVDVLLVYYTDVNK